MIENEKENRYKELYLDIALRVSQMSHCLKRKVGCVIVRDGRILSMGWNGMPNGFDNVCELGQETNPEVIHAEGNALAKLACSTDSSEGASVYTTTSPCVECAKLLIQSKVNEVIFQDSYHDTMGIELLTKGGVDVYHYNRIDE